jgi:hypothetical protein
MADPQVSDAEHELFGGPLRPTAATQEHDGNPRTLDHTDTLELPVTGDGPFNALHTFWKSSHYATGLEAHTESCSWRTFRVSDLVVGVRLHAEDLTVIADIYTDGDFKPAYREELTRRLISSYGFDEDQAAFAELASRVPAMREALAALGGMRQSCPEDHFEIAVIAVLLHPATPAPPASTSSSTTTWPSLSPRSWVPAPTPSQPGTRPWSRPEPDRPQPESSGRQCRRCFSLPCPHRARRDPRNTSKG